MVRSCGCFRREPTAETVQVGSRKPTRPRTNFPEFPSKRAGVHLQAGCRDAVHADQHADPVGAYAAPLKKSGGGTSALHSDFPEQRRGSSTIAPLEAACCSWPQACDWASRKERIC